MDARKVRLGPNTFLGGEHAGSASLQAALQGFARATVREQIRTGDLSGSLARAAATHPEARALFEWWPGAGAGPAARPRAEVLFPTADPLTGLSIGNLETGDSLSVDITDAELGPDVAALIRTLAGGGQTVEQLRGICQGTFAELIDELLAERLLISGTAPPPARLGHTNAITRLEHAGLMIRWGDSTVLVDPVFHSTAPDAPAMDISFSALPAPVDAILLSHSHTDHYSPTSLMMFPPDTPVVVPRVPRSSLLCPDMAAELRRLGFTRVIDVPWYAPALSFADISIGVLPFFGEQPLLSESPSHEDLRNWGNTYLISTPGFRAWVLIDSGNDHAGRMVDVAAEVADTVGPVDLVLSNLRRFYVGTGLNDPCYITGSGEYWLSFSPEQLERFPGMQRDLLTLGPTGVARVCAVVQARAFLPYAHWWQAPGVTIPGEREMCTELQDCLRDEHCATAVLPWTVGDGYGQRGGQLARLPGRATGNG